jgi:hypothetical protein
MSEKLAVWTGVVRHGYDGSLAWTRAGWTERWQ